MTVCLSTSSLGSQWFYPVADPYRTAGPGPYRYGYLFAWDGVQVTVTRNYTSRTEMRIEITTPSWMQNAKFIQAFNFYNNDYSDHITSWGNPNPDATTIYKRWPLEACDVGTDTVVLARDTAFGTKAMYTFPREDFWDFWGGCLVRFDWVGDADPFLGQIGPSGAQTPAPKYPMVQLPDGTLMRSAAGPGLRVVFGGTDFPVDPGWERTRIRARAFPANPPIPFFQLPAIPADFTVLREYNRPEVFVVFGGAKFLFPDPQTLMALGFTWNDVRVIPRGGTSKLRAVPIDGTLIKEQHDQSVFLAYNGQLRFASPAVMEATCLPSRLVRTVPDTTLAALPRGFDLELP